MLARAEGQTAHRQLLADELVREVCNQARTDVWAGAVATIRDCIWVRDSLYGFQRTPYLGHDAGIDGMMLERR